MTRKLYTFILTVILFLFIAACTTCSERFDVRLLVNTQNELNREVRENFADPSVFKVVARPIIIATPAVTATGLGAMKPIVVSCPYTSIGTASIITPDGYAITVTHVVDTQEDYERCLSDLKEQFVETHRFVSLYDWKMIPFYTATNAAGEVYPLQVISTEPTDKGDKALVFIPPKEGQRFKPVILSEQENLSDEMVAVIGTPVGVKDIIVTGKVARSDLYRSKIGNFLLIAAPVYPGNSGGPAITLSDRKVIGMVDQILTSDGNFTELTCLIPAKDIKAFLKKELPDRRF